MGDLFGGVLKDKTNLTKCIKALEAGSADESTCPVGTEECIPFLHVLGEVIQSLQAMKSFFIFIASCISVHCFSQGGFEYEPNFSAVIVRDIRVSVDWYKSVFGLTIKTESVDDKSGYKVTIMESENLLLELIELRGSLTRDELLAGRPDGTQVQGHFKVGFRVKNIDDCLKRLAELNIEIPQVWQDKISGKRNFIIKDPDENLIQFFD